jgi:hypothetical protein
VTAMVAQPMILMMQHVVGYGIDDVLLARI